MKKPYILLKEEMKKEISEVITKHINIVYASDIADHLTKIVSELNRISEQQLQEATKQYEKSLNNEEVVEDDTHTPTTECISEEEK